ncbi:hypothetical protein HPSD74_1664 [Glaesserella parasuis D74]|nr:hypothetical protein HPSD74_1664 [Glaesserella parasuis D74]
MNYQYKVSLYLISIKNYIMSESCLFPQLALLLDILAFI